MIPQVWTYIIGDVPGLWCEHLSHWLGCFFSLVCVVCKKGWSKGVQDFGFLWQTWRHVGWVPTFQLKKKNNNFIALWSSNEANSLNSLFTVLLTNCKKEQAQEESHKPQLHTMLHSHIFQFFCYSFLLRIKHYSESFSMSFQQTKPRQKKTAKQMQ